MESHSVSMLTVTLKLKSIHNIITHIYLHMHIVMYTSRVDSVRSVHTVPFFFSFFHFSSNCLNLSGFVFKAFCIRTCVCVRAFRKQRHYNPRALVFFQPQYLGQQTEKWCKTYLEASSHAKGVLLQTSQVWSHQGWSFKTLQTGCNKIATVNTTLTILPFLR